MPAKRTVTSRKPKIERAIEIACKRLSERALGVLENALDERKTPDIDYKLRIMAAQEILSRAWGKPKISQETNINVKSEDSFLEAMKAARQRVVENVPLPELEGTGEPLPEQSKTLN